MKAKEEMSAKSITDTTTSSATHAPTTKDVYEGTLKDGKRHGRGKPMFDNGRIYESDFVDGKFDGKGRQIWPDPDGGCYDVMIEQTKTACWPIDFII